MMAISGIGILLPRLKGILVANSLSFATIYLMASPVASNNQTTAFFFALVVLGATWTTFWAGRQSGSRDDHFELIARAGRWLLPSMYFFGIYHKINTDFLDPAVSCAVVLYEALFNGSWLSNWNFGQYGAIHATFVFEGIAMVALFIPRLKVYGMLIGIPFHLIIGFTGYAYYKDFSTIVLVLYSLFIPRAAYAAAFAAIARYSGNGNLALRLGRWALVGFVCAYVITGAMRDAHGLMPTHEIMVPFFAIYGICFYLFAVICTPRHGSLAPKRAAGWLMVVPLIYFLNGWSPYLGLKTESSISMYSNLHTEGGQTNHLIHGVIPATWSYQNDLVTPVSSNSPAFDAAYIGTGLALVRYEFDRLLATQPGPSVTVATTEGIVSSDAGWVNTYLTSNPIAQNFLIFKPVDLNHPKVCSH
ncbi:hypothetical protein AIOL_001511 [Candidatus Rhodobacter oscarellae]|uniref:Uncharacterized protein n=2 Tax=Candidatus Rhodobacter oscarellae TaxID=1675527 RepID=A0A0J9E1J1_9RHOB|nr:hypothetical protein AIOL_001511 [Candidatus Rhodobacter lobularis]